MLLAEFFAPQINEGGAVFPETVAIKKEYVPEIVKQIKKLLSGMEVHPDIGSAGYKIQSGDMDVMIDAQELADKFGAADVKAAKKALQELLNKKSLDTKLSGQNVHVKMPLPDGSFGQVDIMVIPDAKMVAPYHQHGPRGSYEDPDFKGSEIFILIASIAKSMNLKFEPFGAKLVKRDTGDLVARSRDDVARILLNPNATGDDLNSVKSIMNALKDDPKREEKLAQARADAAKGLIKLPEAKEPNQLKATDIAKTIAPKPFAGSQPHPFKGKLVGSESKMNEEGNPTDKIQMDVPLFLRMMEYAKEDAKTDMDLHKVTERAIELMQQHDYLCMDNYDEIINGETQMDEGWLDDIYSAGRNFADTATLGGYKYARAGADYVAKNAMHQLGYRDKGTSYQKELDQEVEKLDKDWKENPGASLAGMGSALAVPVAGEYGAAVKGAQGIAGQALDAYGKAVKMYPLAKSALGFKDAKNPKVEDIEEKLQRLLDDTMTVEAKKKNKPTNPELWSRAKSAARSKFEVYPSAYANAWAAKWYKSKGGGWRKG